MEQLDFFVIQIFELWAKHESVGGASFRQISFLFHRSCSHTLKWNKTRKKLIDVNLSQNGRSVIPWFVAVGQQKRLGRRQQEKVSKSKHIFHFLEIKKWHFSHPLLIERN